MPLTNGRCLAGKILNSATYMLMDIVINVPCHRFGT